MWWENPLDVNGIAQLKKTFIGLRKGLIRHNFTIGQRFAVLILAEELAEIVPRQEPLYSVGAACIGGLNMLGEEYISKRDRRMVCKDMIEYLNDFLQNYQGEDNED